MNSKTILFLKLTVAILLCSIGGTAHTLPIKWSNLYSSHSGAKMARDETGALYFATRTPTLTGRRVTLQKINAAGVEQWNAVINDTEDTARQYDIRSVQVSPTYVILLSHVRTNSGTGSLVSCQMRVYNRSTGTHVVSHIISTEEWASVATNGAQIAVLSRVISTSEAKIRFYSHDTVTMLSEVPLGPCVSASEVRMDATNSAVANIYQSNGLTKMFKASHVGGIILQYEFNAASRYDEMVQRMEWDPVSQRAYALVDAKYSASDTDVLLFVWNTSTGAQVAISVLRSAVGHDYSGDLTVIPGIGLYASGYSPSLSVRSFFRRDPNSVVQWGQTYSIAAGGGSSIQQSIDGDNNLVTATASTAGTFAIDKYTFGAGVPMLHIEVSVPSTPTPQKVTCDAAGNFYLHVPNVNDTYLMRVQPAQLTFSANNVAGGAVVSANITLSSAALSNQVWTITSGNPALVGAPGTTTITTGNTSASIPLTVAGVSAATNVSINVRHGGFVDQQTLTLVASLPQSVTATPQVTVGGSTIAGSILLTGQAKAGGQTVNLTSNKPLVASVPASVNIAEGANSANFAITTYGVNANQGVVITATSGAVQKTVFIAVNAPALTSISVNPTTIKGGVTGILTLNISGPAPTGGFAIALISGAPGLVMLPAQSSVNAGQTSRNLSMPTAAVTSSTNVLVFATRSGIYKTATLTVTP